MAANYWASTQHIFWEEKSRSKSQDAEAAADLSSKFPLPDPRLVNIFLQQQLTKLAKRFPNSPRQVILATAFVFIRRLYTRVDIRETNPYLVLATAFYLACKIEECPQHIKLVASEARTLWPDYIQTDMSKLGECEFFVISKINAQLIVHHPYRSLAELQTTLALTQDEMTLAWSVVNDQYVTELPLKYPPHIIATAAVTLVLAVLRPAQQSSSTSGSNNNNAAANNGQTQQQQQQHQSAANKIAQALGTSSADSLMQAATSGKGRPQRLIAWLSQSNLDIDAIIDSVQHLVSLYVLWEQYNEKDCKDRITLFIKSQGLDR